MAAHRYWRLNITANGAGGTNCAVGELFGWVAGQDDQGFTGGVATASSTLGGFPASNAFDNNINTFWATAAFVNPSWIKYDFGATAGNWRDIRQITLYGRQDGFYNQNPTTCDFQWSDDDITYTSAFGALTIPPFTAAGQSFSTASPGPANHERVGTAEILTAVGMPAVAERVSSFFSLTAIAGLTPKEQTSWAAGLVATKDNNFDMRVTNAAVLVAVRGRIANPKLRAWTFTLDGHDFYVLRLGIRTTLVYDVYSEQWMDWDSFGETYWPVNVGINWVGGMGILDADGSSFNSNVLVGDDTYGLLWFLDPNQPFDENPEQLEPQQQIYFPRIIQGQFPVVGREAVPCYAVWLTTDMGDPAYVGAGVLLEISDDAGKTYGDMGTVTVTPGTNTPEIAWYSLGQIMAPGRLFRLTDDGAIARIDSMEMNDPEKS